MNPNRSARPGSNAFVGQEGPGHGWSRKLHGDEYAPDEMFQKFTHHAEREWDSYLLHWKLDFYNKYYAKQAEEVAQPQQKKQKIDVDAEHPAAFKKFDCQSLIDAGTAQIPHSDLSRTKLGKEREPALARTFGAWQAQKWAASRVSL